MKLLTILFIVTSHAMMGTGGEPTGVWLEELTTPYYAFTDAGYEVEIVTVSGGDIPIDPRSLSEDAIKEESVTRYLQDEKFQALVKNTKSAGTLGDTSHYAAVFFPGGHGTMWDYPDNPILAKIITDTLDSGRIVAAVCHGPAVFVGVTNKDGKPLVSGRKIAAFTNAEETAVGLTEKVPFLLQSKLAELGADIQTTENFAPLAVIDGALITGQNPASAKPVAEAIISILGIKDETPPQ